MTTATNSVVTNFLSIYKQKYFFDSDTRTIVTINSANTEAIAAPLCSNIGIIIIFAIALIIAPQIVASKILFSFATDIKIIWPKKYATENIPTKILNIFNVTIVGLNAFPNNTATIYSDVINNPAIHGSATIIINFKPSLNNLLDSEYFFSFNNLLIRG